MNINRALFIFFDFSCCVVFIIESRVIVIDDFHFYDSSIFLKYSFPIQILEAFGDPMDTWTDVHGMHMLLHSLEWECHLFQFQHSKYYCFKRILWF